jgi:RHS repeat-associated protein
LPFGQDTGDPAGRLYQTAQASGATTRFLYDGANLIGEYNASNALLRRYVQGPGLDAPLVRYDGTGTSNRRWLITDERGSVVAETNASGAAVQINTYDEYGMPGSGNTSRFGYTGQMWIAEIGLYHYRNRVYNPRIGRFMQTDPIGQRGGINLYAYVSNDPVNHTDPWGLSRLPTFDSCVNISKVDAHSTLYCWNHSNAASLSWGASGYPHMDGGGGPGASGPGADGQEGECPEASYREGLSPIYSRFDSPEAAVNAIARSAFDYATGLGIEVGGYIVRSGSQYRLTSLIHGSAISVEFNTTNLRAAQQRGQIVGAWHVHPSGDPHFSAADGSTLNFIAGHSGVAPNPTFFAVGSDGRFGALRYRGGAPYPPRDRGVNYEADTVTRSTCGG